MEDKAREVEKLKSEVYDLMVQQEALKATFLGIENKKRELNERIQKLQVEENKK